MRQKPWILNLMSSEVDMASQPRFLMIANPIEGKTDLELRFEESLKPMRLHRQEINAF
jgi:hypothetical protein